LNIELIENTVVTSVAFYDVVGKKVKEITSPLQNNNLIQVNISDLRNGVYSVVITDKTSVDAVKVSLIR
jgi:hypothetical protein